MKDSARDPPSQRLDQVRGLAFDDVPRDRPDSPVIDGVIDVIRPCSPCEIGFDLDVHSEALRASALGVAQPVLATELQALEQDPIHACNSAFHRLAPVELFVRPAVTDDLEALNAIYNEYVIQSHATFDVEPTTAEWRREWFTHYGSSGRYRVVVAVADARLIGYASSSRFRPKPAYETSVEVSVYVTGDAVGHGVGARLYTTLFTSLEGADVHRAYAGIALPNPASVALHERFGFHKVAHFTEQGRKFGRFWDVAWYEKSLGGA